MNSVDSKPPTDSLKIVSINTLFDGVNTENMNFWGWLWLHINVFAGRWGYLKRKQSTRVEKHSLERIIEIEQPDVVIATEVVLGGWGSQSMQILNEYEYNYTSIGYPAEVRNQLNRDTVVASKSIARAVDIPVRNVTGGGFTGLVFESLNLLVVGFQGAAFNQKVRESQLDDVIEFCNAKEQEGLHVVIAGDFNVELPGEYAEMLRSYQVFSANTFPADNLVPAFERVGAIFQPIVRQILSLRNGQKRIDHFVVSKGVSLADFHVVDVGSDHMGIVGRVE